MTPLLDVNILIYAHRDELPRHVEARTYLEQLRHEDELFGIPELVFSAFTRIVTAAKPFVPPTPTATALDFCNAVLASPSCLSVRPCEKQWSIFERLCRATNARGKLVPDAYLAAMAIDQGFVFVTTDTDYARFPGLTWRELRDGQPRTNPR